MQLISSKTKRALLYSVVLLLSPSIALAADALSFSTLIKKIVNVINLALPVVGGLIVLVFMWGVVRYVFSASGEKSDSKALIIWGLVGIFVSVSIWGIIQIFRATLGV